jgi:hypothetical protein
MQMGVVVGLGLNGRTMLSHLRLSSLRCLLRLPSSAAEMGLADSAGCSCVTEWFERIVMIDRLSVTTSCLMLLMLGACRRSRCGLMLIYLMPLAPFIGSRLFRVTSRHVSSDV